MQKGRDFHGKLTEMPVDFPIEKQEAVNFDDPIWIVDHTRLREMSAGTLKSLKNCKVLITNSG